MLTDLVDAVAEGAQMLENCYGCPLYVAPESISGATYNGMAADMWSVGVITYTLLAGYYPFSDPDRNTLFLKIRSGRYTIPVDVSPLAKSMIASLLSHDPQKRPAARMVQHHPWLTNPPSSSQDILIEDQVVPATNEQ